MHKLLVPIENFSGRSLSATYFAVEFAKRNPAKIFFLIFSRIPREGNQSAARKQDDLQRNQFEELIQRARSEKINLEIFYSNEDFYEATSQFCKDHGLTEIIVALPSERDPAYPGLVDQISQWRNNLESQLIIVKPKEEKLMTLETAGRGVGPTPVRKSKPHAGGKGS